MESDNSIALKKLDNLLKDIDKGLLEQYKYENNTTIEKLYCKIRLEYYFQEKM